MSTAAPKAKHAPSSKLALDDVLKSLQDLIRNDLPDTSSAPAAESSPPPPAAGPTPSARDLILELEAGLADLARLDTGTAAEKPITKVVAHAPDKASKPKPPMEPNTPPVASPGLKEEWVATLESLTLPPPSPSPTSERAKPAVASQPDAIAFVPDRPRETGVDFTPPASAPLARADTVTPEQAAISKSAHDKEPAPWAASPATGFEVEWVTAPKTPDLPAGRPPAQDTQEDFVQEAETLSLAGFEVTEEMVATTPPEEPPPEAAPIKPVQSKPALTFPQGDLDLDTLEGVQLTEDLTATQVADFIQDEASPDSGLDTLPGVNLDFSDTGETFTIERDQSLSPGHDTPQASSEPHSWHTPELSLPMTDVPAEVTLSLLDEPMATPPARPAPAGRQSELPLPAPPAHTPRAATPAGPALSIAPTTPASPRKLAPVSAVKAVTAPAKTSSPRDTSPRDTSPKVTSPRVTSPGVTSQGDSDNIPLLQDVIDTHAPAARAALPNTPTAEQARRMAIQVAARLNVELRRSGKRTLSSDIITRLARMLQETLALSPPNVDNKPHNKG